MTACRPLANGKYAHLNLTMLIGVTLQGSKCLIDCRWACDGVRISL
jgi:hypothetical protein